jgi:hypothetical protein
VTGSGPRGVVEDSASAALERDLADLRTVLAEHPFPARQDDLMAACLSRHEPVRLCSRLSTLSRTTVYTSVDDVLDAVAARA